MVVEMIVMYTCLIYSKDKKNDESVKKQARECRYGNEKEGVRE